jgi:superfamily II DNA or RNA helicase
MKYQGKEVQIISKKTVFGKEIAEIRVLSTGEILSVPAAVLDDSQPEVLPFEIRFKAIAAKIRNEIFAQKMIAPFESNVIPLPHQILALEKVMSGQYLRFLMADEVGMGKTIETGLILKELKLRGIVKRTLVIVPVSAMLQWKQELKNHFNESFNIYDTEYINTLTRTFTQLEADNEINFWTQHNQLIVSMDSLRPIEHRQGWSKQKVEEYNKYRIESVLEAEFDLLVIDECHKVGGSTPWVGRFQMADILCNAIPNVLLLSATPHRGKSDHFRRILQLLDADAFSGEGMPSIPELEPYVIRTEKRQAIDFNGKKLFNKRRTQKMLVEYDDVRHDKQRQLYEDVTEYVIEGFNRAQQTKNTSYGFVMLLFQRLMSSSTQAILDAMQKRADRLSAEKSDVTKENLLQNIDSFDFPVQLELDFEEKINNIIETTHANYDTELSELQSLIAQSKECLLYETDAKIEFLLEKLSELKKAENNPDLKFLIFTEFTSTQRMLKQILEERGGYICDAINGSMEFEQRVEALKRFKNEAQILVSTDAAGESLNMQFAHVVINYDMPWNPMVVEQRIGRVDRIGQTHEVVALNLLLDNSVDNRVYEVIETKLNQIMNELGIDKTSDVLDSTLESESINKLYLASLLNPSKFEAESTDWLANIKEKLLDYQSTEGALPTLNSSEIKADKVETIKHSPLPNWLENLTVSYLATKDINYQRTPDGLKFRIPGFKENIYTFDIRGSVNNPIPEPVSMQHEIIQKLLSEAVSYTETQPVPRIKINSGSSQSGIWSLWSLQVKNEFETQNIIQPVFYSDTGQNFPAFAQDIWTRLATVNDSFALVGAVNSEEAVELYKKTVDNTEQVLQPKYLEYEEKINLNTEKLKANKEKSFDFQEKQIRKIGIENIRQARLQRLSQEKEIWRNNFDTAGQVLPNLSCLQILKID